MSFGIQYYFQTNRSNLGNKSLMLTLGINLGSFFNEVQPPLSVKAV